MHLLVLLDFFYWPKWQNCILLLVSSLHFHMSEAWSTEVPLSVGTSPYGSLRGGPPLPEWGTRFYFLKNVYQYLTKPSRRCHSWVCLTSLLISSGLGRTITQDTLAIASPFLRTLWLFERHGIYNQYIYISMNKIHVWFLLNFLAFRRMYFVIYNDQFIARATKCQLGRKQRQSSSLCYFRW